MDDQGFVKQPLSASFLFIGLIGFFATLYSVVYLAFDITWGLLLMLMFAIFGLAALKSVKMPKRKVVRKAKRKKVAKKRKAAKRKPAKKRKVAKKKPKKKKAAKRKKR